MDFLFDLINRQNNQISSLETQQQMIKINIIIRYNNDSIPIDVYPYEPFYKILSKLRKKIFISEDFLLTYAGIIIHEDDMFYRSSIPENAVIYAVDCPRNKILIFIKTFHMGYIPLSVSPKIKIFEIKSMLDSLYDIPTDDQKLLFNNQILDDNNNICDYKIINHSLIHLNSTTNFKRK